MKPLCLYLFALVSAFFACGQSSTQTERVLTKVADIPMPVPAVRFDYRPLTHRVGGCISRIRTPINSWSSTHRRGRFSPISTASSACMA
jgi:hypothetical protein